MTGAPTCGRSGGDRARAFGVDRVGQIRLVLGPVNRRVGGCGNHDVRPCRRNRRHHRARIGKIEVGAADGDEFDIRQRRRTLDEAARDLAFAPGDENSQSPSLPGPPSRSPAYRPLRIGSHHHSLSRYHLMVLASPVSNVSAGLQPRSRSIFEASMA